MNCVYNNVFFDNKTITITTTFVMKMWSKVCNEMWSCGLVVKSVMLWSFGPLVLFPLFWIINMKCCDFFVWELSSFFWSSFFFFSVNEYNFFWILEYIFSQLFFGLNKTKFFFVYKKKWTFFPSLTNWKKYFNRSIKS